jgi:hypothetical protein
MTIDLTVWNLTTPEPDADGDARTWPLAIDVPDHEFFSRTAEGNVMFTAPVIGATTESTDRTRSELREIHPDGTLRNWTHASTASRLRAALTLFSVPANGVTVIGQIHSKGPAPGGDPLVKLKWKRGLLAASVRATPTSDPVDSPVLDVPLNARFTYSIGLSLLGDLSVTVTYGDRSGRFMQRIRDWSAVPLYFKAGVYNQDVNGEASKALFYRIEVEH